MNMRVVLRFDVDGSTPSSKEKTDVSDHANRKRR
jgi:hypothetical protein